MKVIDRIILSIYSVIILIESIIAILLIFGWAKLESIVYLITDMLNNSVAYNIVFAISIIFIILSIKAMFFNSSKSRDLTEMEDKRKGKSR